MDGVEPAPPLELVERLAGEGAPARLLGLELAGRRSVPDDSHSRFDERAEPLLALRRASSARFHAVISREMPNVPTTRPSLSRNGILVVETQVTLAAAPGLLFLLADHRMLGLHEGPFILRGLAGVLLGEEVEIRPAHRKSGVAQAEPIGQALLMWMNRPSASLK